MAEMKTRPNPASVTDFLNSVADEGKRGDSFTVLEMMRQASGFEPVMWGDSIVGFGAYHYRYASGREGDMPMIGFSPRVQALTLYIMTGFAEYEDLLARLGKHKTSKACLYIKRLSDVDLDVLRELIEKSVEYMGKTPSEAGGTRSDQRKSPNEVSGASPFDPGGEAPATTRSKSL